MAAKTINDYLSLPYRVEITRSGDGHFARVPELPGCMTWTVREHTLDELEAMVEDAMEAWISDALEDGDPVPEPVGRTGEVTG